MGNLKSCLVFQDRVFCPDYNDHQDMIDKLGIKGGYQSASKPFVRVELLPPDGVKSLMEPLDSWTLKVDQDVTPDWWDEEADRPRVEEAVEEWRKEHVFADGEHSIKTGIVYALGGAKVEAWDDAAVNAYDNAKVIAYNSAYVDANDSAMVEAWGYAMVIAHDRARLDVSDYARAETYDNTVVDAGGEAAIEAWGNTTVKACDNTVVKAYENAAVEAIDNATVIYPSEKKIICPAGWTTEEHG